MLRAVGGAFSGGSPELLVGRALLHAVREEVRRATRAGARGG
jgi:hypothetical protein